MQLVASCAPLFNAAPQMASPSARELHWDGISQCKHDLSARYASLEKGFDMLWGETLKHTHLCLG